MPPERTNVPVKLSLPLVSISIARDRQDYALTTSTSSNISSTSSPNYVRRMSWSSSPAAWGCFTS
jgi:hypothetical protein